MIAYCGKIGTVMRRDSLPRLNVLVEYENHIQLRITEKFLEKDDKE